MLSDILEDYQEADETLKKELLHEFIDLIWKSKCRYNTYKKIYTYDVNDELLDDRQDLIELFNKHRIIELDFCKSFYKKKLTSADYIRVHINNMFGYLTDKDVYLSKQYYEMVMSPRNLYYIVVNKLKNNEEVNYNEIRHKIDYALEKAPVIKKIDQEKKIELTWKEYKKLINTYIERLFNNYTPPHEYEKEHGWEMKVNVNGWSDDNFAVKYFNRSLTWYLKNYVKKIKPKENKLKYCMECGGLITNVANNLKYCEECRDSIHKSQIIEWKSKNKKENKKSKAFIGKGKYKSSIQGKSTPQYIAWKSMLNRCYSEKYLERQPTYQDCEVCDEWVNFQNFAEWYDINFYQIEGQKMCLDKDILNKNNHVYSPDNCIFVPKTINSLFIKSNSKRGSLPIGITYNHKEKRYYAHISKNNKKVHIGTAKEITEAFELYKTEKEKYIKEVANKYKSSIPDILYEAMISYEVEITD